MLFDPALAQQSGDETKSSHDKIITYQGRLTDGEGNPVTDGNHTLVFRLYDQQSGGSALWTETQNVTTSNGVFSVQLGSVNAMNSLAFDQQYYLGIEVDGGSELTPRTALNKTPYAIRAQTVAEDGVTSDAIADDAVTEAKIAARSITTDKFDYAAVDSAAIDPDAVFKTLRPTLEINGASEFVGINRGEPVTGSDVFAVQAPVTFDDTFGGMYINTEGVESWPFYGYATDGESHAWTVFDKQANEWILEYDFVSPRHRLVVDDESVHPGGDGDVKLGTSNHRWAEVYSTNGSVQTSDRRLKTNIQTMDYGLDQVMELNPVTYQWKEGVSDQERSSEKKLGLIAQEVQKVLSEVVKEPGNKEGYLGMNYSELVPVLVKAIQEQQSQIRALKDQLNDRRTASKNEVEQLRKQVQRLAEQLGERKNHQPESKTAEAE